MFRVFKTIHHLNKFSISNQKTNHFNSKEQRLNNYGELIYAEQLIGFVVSRSENVKLVEAHIVLQNGIILIFNASNKKLITIINPRPGQFVRYFERLNLEMNTEHIAALASAHNRNVCGNLNNK